MALRLTTMRKPREFETTVRQRAKAVANSPISNKMSADRHERGARREGRMVAGGFDSEALSLMQAMLDQAWADLPPDRQTPEPRERIAQAVVMLAIHWERDPAR